MTTVEKRNRVFYLTWIFQHRSCACNRCNGFEFFRKGGIEFFGLGMVCHDAMGILVHRRRDKTSRLIKHTRRWLRANINSAKSSCYALIVEEKSTTPVNPKAVACFVYLFRRLTKHVLLRGLPVADVSARTSHRESLNNTCSHTHTHTCQMFVYIIYDIPIKES